MSLRIFPDDVSSGATAIGFDVTVSEEALYVATPTSSPTERGNPITDNVRNEPIQINAEVLVTGTPSAVTFYGAGSSVLRSIPGPYGNVDVFTFELPPGTDVAAETEARLKALRDAKSTCNVALTTGFYPSMVLTSFSRTKNRSGNAGVFRLTFSEIEIVDSATVTAPVPKEPKGAPKVNAGKAPAAPPSIVDQLGLKGFLQPGKSTAVSVIDFVTGGL